MDVKYISREIQILKKLNSERVVRYIDTIIDDYNLLYIQMEFCSDNLKNILKYKNIVFNRKMEEEMSELEYYISCKIFMELLEAMDYLHKLTPPIIHRDIKPANILFTEKGMENGIFFKLCDFGLAKLYEKDSNSVGMGTDKYMAPEVWDGCYETKANIYSLSIILYELFNLVNNSERSHSLKEYFDIIEELSNKMSSKLYKKRPSCNDIIEKQNKWGFSYMPLIDIIQKASPECHSLNIYMNYHSKINIHHQNSFENQSSSTKHNLKNF